MLLLLLIGAEAGPEPEPDPDPEPEPGPATSGERIVTPDVSVEFSVEVSVEDGVAYPRRCIPRLTLSHRAWSIYDKGGRGERGEGGGEREGERVICTRFLTL